MDEEHSILELSFQMGEILLRNGAEISRVQETMERVAQSYHAEKFNVYVLTNGIFAVGTEQGKERSVELRHIISTTTHMGRICAVNQLSREIAHGEHTVEEAFQILKGIREMPYSPLSLSILCCAVGSACFRISKRAVWNRKCIQFTYQGNCDWFFFASFQVCLCPGDRQPIFYGKT